MSKSSQLSPQRAYQIRNAALGRCALCPAPVLSGSTHCEAHNRKRKLKQRKAAQCKPWHQGGPGRPPIAR